MTHWIYSSNEATVTYLQSYQTKNFKIINVENCCELVLGDAIRPCTNGVSLLHRIATASEQTANHVLIACRIQRAPHGARGLTVLDDETRCCLKNITASI